MDMAEPLVLDQKGMNVEPTALVIPVVQDSSPGEEAEGMVVADLGVGGPPRYGGEPLIVVPQQAFRNNPCSRPF